MNRKYYIDNLRWSCILLLIPFHTAMTFNSWGEGNYIYLYPNKSLSFFIIMISTLYMPLLFVLAGISARYAMNKRNTKGFIKERVFKLLIPMISGILTVVAIMTFYADRFHNNYQGTYFEHYGVFFTKFTTLTGYDGGFTPSHLWFLLYLFIVSLLGTIIINIQKRILPKFKLTNISILSILLIVILIAISDQLLNIADKSICKFLILYLAGFYILSDEENLNKISSFRYFYLLIMLVTDMIYAYMFVYCDNFNRIICGILSYMACWFGILTIIGFARIGFNQNNKLTHFFTKYSFLFYIFHFMWLVMIQYYLIQYTNHVVTIYIVSILLGYIFTIPTCVLVANIPIIRSLFGIKKK